MKGDWSSSWLQSSFWSATFTQPKSSSQTFDADQDLLRTALRKGRETMQPLSSAPELDQGLDGFLPRATSWSGSYRFDHSSVCVLFIGLIDTLDTLITTMIRVTCPHHRLRD